VEEPLEYLSRKELQLKIMQNIEREIMNMSPTSKLRCWWERSSNWVKVQKFLNGNTVKAGSTSSTAQCLFIGIDPDGDTFYEKTN
jgi:hypothetical protein